MVREIFRNTQFTACVQFLSPLQKWTFGPFPKCWTFQTGHPTLLSTRDCSRFQNKMSFAQYKSIAVNYSPYKICDDLYCVPDYTVSKKGLRVRKHEFCVVERRCITTKDAPRVVYVCWCSKMKRVRDVLEHMHHYDGDNVPMDTCFHASLVKECASWTSPDLVVDDVIKLTSGVYVVRAERPVLVSKGRRGLVCSVCKKVSCQHVGRLETVAIDRPDLDIDIDEHAPEDKKRRGVSRDAIETPQQKISIAPVPSKQKRCPDRSGRVARVYDTDGYTEYTYKDGETLNSLRHVSCDRIFRYSREVWFTHRIVYLYIDNMARGNACFDAFHHTMELQYARSGQQFCSKPTTRTVLQAALYHLDLDVEGSLTCAQCKEIPLRHRVFIVDGTSNGFLNATKTSRYNDPSSSCRKERPGSDFALIRTRHIRAVVLNGLSKDDFSIESYIKDIWDVDVPGFVQFVKHSLTHCPREDVALFMKDIASPYPITATVQRSMVLPDGGLLKRCLGQPISIEDRDLLRHTWPSLYRLCRNFTGIPGSWSQLLISIRDLALSIYTTPDTEYLVWQKTTEEHTFVCFPEFPRCRKNPLSTTARMCRVRMSAKSLPGRSFRHDDDGSLYRDVFVAFKNPLLVPSTINTRCRSGISLHWAHVSDPSTSRSR
jgi:hypothetical protein